MQINTFKKILIIFWAIWWTIAFLTDFTGGLKQLGLVHAQWIYNENFPGLVQSLKLYSAPIWLSVVFFIGIIVWSLISCILFWRACFYLTQSKERWMQYATTAFTISLSFWLAFFIADQIVMKFVLEENHMVQAGFELLSFMLITFS